MNVNAVERAKLLDFDARLKKEKIFSTPPISSTQITNTISYMSSVFVGSFALGRMKLNNRSEPILKP